MGKLKKQTKKPPRFYSLMHVTMNNNGVEKSPKKSNKKSDPVIFKYILILYVPAFKWQGFFLMPNIIAHSNLGTPPCEMSSGSSQKGLYKNTAALQAKKKADTYKKRDGEILTARHARWTTVAFSGHFQHWRMWISLLYESEHTKSRVVIKSPLWRSA